MVTGGVDFGARYTVAGYGGVAFYLTGYAITHEEVQYEYEGDDGPEYEYEYETVDDTSMVRAVMVGDDYEWIVDVDDLTMIGEDDYCHECGQIGCGWS